MDNQHTTLMSGITGAGLAVANNLTGIFNEPLFIAHLQDDVLKALVVGFVGAIGGLIGKAVYSFISKAMLKWKL